VGQQLSNVATDTTFEAQTCRLYYNDTRDRLLREWPWPFATAYATLPQVGAQNPNLQWGYAYTLPANCLRTRFLMPANEIPTSLFGSPIIDIPWAFWWGGSGWPYPIDQWSIPFGKGIDSSGNELLFTDETPANLVYTAQITDESMFDVSFGRALEWAMAAELVMPLSINETRAEKVAQGSAAALAGARNIAENEIQNRPPPPSSFEAARY
jgi:hypothetical protein